jgi:hypothetical protein
MFYFNNKLKNNKLRSCINLSAESYFENLKNKQLFKKTLERKHDYNVKRNVEFLLSTGTDVLWSLMPLLTNLLRSLDILTFP